MGLFNHFIERLTHTSAERVPPHIHSEQFLERFDNYHHLMKLQDKRQLVEVLIPGYKNSFQSMIIGIDFMDNTFRLDEFSPFFSSPDNIINQTITIRHQSGWEKLEITASVKQWSAQDNSYSLELPEFIDYQPRRSYPRLTLDNHNLLKTHINPPYGAPWYATVKDISQGGMRIAINGDLRPHLHKDKALPKCQIQLDKQLHIHTRGLIRAFSYSNKPSRHTDISIEFSNMSQLDKSHLKRFIEYVEVAA